MGGGVIFLHFVGGVLACEAPCVWSVLCRAGVGGVLCAILTRQRVFGGVSHLSPVPACAPVIFLTVSAWGAVVIRVVPFMREGCGVCASPKIDPAFLRIPTGSNPLCLLPSSLRTTSAGERDFFCCCHLVLCKTVR